MTPAHRGEKMLWTNMNWPQRSLYPTNISDRRHVYPPIAQLVERRTVVKEDILRSLVRFRVGGSFLFCVEGTIGWRKPRKNTRVTATHIADQLFCRIHELKLFGHTTSIHPTKTPRAKAYIAGESQLRRAKVSIERRYPQVLNRIRVTEKTLFRKKNIGYQKAWSITKKRNDKSTTSGDAVVN